MRVLLIGIILAHSQVVAGASIGTNGTHRIVKGIRVDYHPDVEHIVDGLADATLSADPSNPVAGAVAAKEHQDAALMLLAQSLSLEAPGKHMTKAYNKIADGFAHVLRCLPNPQHVRIWKIDEFKTFAGSGKVLIGWNVDVEGDKIEFKLDTTSEEKVVIPDPMPILVDPSAPTSETITKAVERIRKLQDLKQQLPTFGLLLHEVAEVGIVKDVGVGGSRRRWFADGVANYLAWVALKEFATPAEAEAFLSAYATAPYSDLEDNVELGSWLAMEAAPKPRTTKDKRLEDARYAFATREIFELFDRNGDDVIPRIFAELSKTTDVVSLKLRPSITSTKTHDIDTVLDAIQSVTGEDFRARLRRYTGKEM